MTEQDWIIATNQTKVNAAIKILQDVLPGEEWGISKEQRGSILDELHIISEQLSKAVKIKD